jgi:hypothetical protein
MARKRFTPPCPICGKPRGVHPTCGRVYLTCARPPCVRALKRRRMQAYGAPAKAVVAATKARQARMWAVLRLAVDGALTDRDRAVWAAVFKYAYLKGYHAGRRFVTRTQVAA